MQIHLDREELADAAAHWVLDRLEQEDDGPVVEVAVTIHDAGRGATATVTYNRAANVVDILADEVADELADEKADDKPKGKK